MKKLLLATSLGAIGFLATSVSSRAGEDMVSPNYSAAQGQGYWVPAPTPGYPPYNTAVVAPPPYYYARLRHPILITVPIMGQPTGLLFTAPAQASSLVSAFTAAAKGA